jgi:DNA-binding XRE family transcriptional regulator
MRRVPRKRSKTTRTDRRSGSTSTSTLHHRETARFRKLSELLAKRLRRLRLQRELTIEQASEAAGVEPITWYRLEHRRSNPTLAVLASVAAVFDLTIASLLDDD